MKFIGHLLYNAFEINPPRARDKYFYMKKIIAFQRRFEWRKSDSYHFARSDRVSHITANLLKNNKVC